MRSIPSVTPFHIVGSLSKKPLNQPSEVEW